MNVNCLCLINGSNASDTLLSITRITSGYNGSITRVLYIKSAHSDVGLDSSWCAGAKIDIINQCGRTITACATCCGGGQVNCYVLNGRDGRQQINVGGNWPAGLVWGFPGSGDPSTGNNAKPQANLAEITVGAGGQDFYDISNVVRAPCYPCYPFFTAFFSSKYHLLLEHRKEYLRLPKEVRTPIGLMVQIVSFLYIFISLFRWQDAYNLPMRVAPTQIAGGGHPSGNHCGTIICAINDLNSFCRPPNFLTGGPGNGCKNVNGPGNNPTDGTRQFKARCPTSYSYSKDDDGVVFGCETGNNYEVVFCPFGVVPGSGPDSII